MGNPLTEKLRVQQKSERKMRCVGRRTSSRMEGFVFGFPVVFLLSLGRNFIKNVRSGVEI